MAVPGNRKDPEFTLKCLLKHLVIMTLLGKCAILNFTERLINPMMDIPSAHKNRRKLTFGDVTWFSFSISAVSAKPTDCW